MKRTTEAVLRAELASRTKEVEKARERLDRADQATRDAHAAGLLAGKVVDHAIQLRVRALMALEAYLGETVEEPIPIAVPYAPDSLAESTSVVPTELAAARRGPVADVVVEPELAAAINSILPSEATAARRGPVASADQTISPLRKGAKK